MTTLPPGSALPSFLQVYLFGRNIIASFEEQRKKYGNIFTMRVPARQKIVVLSDANLIGQLLANDADEIPAFPANKWAQCLFGERSMLFKTGQAHRDERKALKPYLSPQNSAEIADHVSERTRLLLQSMDERPVPIYDWCYSLILRSSVQLFWSCNDDAKLQEIERVVVLTRKHFSSVSNMMLANIALSEARHPWGARIAKLLQKSEHNKLIIRFERVFKQHIAEIRRAPQSFPDSPLRARVLAQSEGDDETDLIHFAITLLIAATDPPSVITAWLLHHLAKDAELQNQIREQVQNGAGSPLLRSCIFEIYRLYPPLHSFTRSLTQDCQLGPYMVPASTWVFPSIYLLHRNPQYWNKPDEFVPDRFVDLQQMPEIEDGFMPFGGSTHACPGRHFALHEIENIVTEILLSHSISSDSEIRKAITIGPSLIPSGKETMQFKRL